MTRGYTRQVMGTYKVTVDGVPSTTAPSQSDFESLTRSDIVQGHTTVKGFKPPNPYFMDFSLETGPFGTWTRRQFGRTYVRSGALWSICDLSNVPGRAAPDPPSHVENACLIKALNAVKDQKVNLRVALGEVQDVADMIAENANRIARGLRHLKRGRFRKALQAIRHTPRKGWDTELASRILEFQYGVRPLVSDIYGAMEALAQARYGTEKAFIVTGRGKLKGGGNVASQFLSNSVGYVPVTVTTRQFWEVRVRLHFEVDDTAFKTASELGFTNPMATAWELLPFSCVIDWAVPVGDWLNSLDGGVGLRFLGGSCTEWGVSNNTYTGAQTSNNGTSVLSGESRRRRHRRTTYDTLPIPYPPRVKNPLSTEHALNALALMTAIFRGGGPGSTPIR